LIYFSGEIVKIKDDPLFSDQKRLKMSRPRDKRDMQGGQNFFEPIRTKIRTFSEEIRTIRKIFEKQSVQSVQFFFKKSVQSVHFFKPIRTFF